MEEEIRELFEKIDAEMFTNFAGLLNNFEPYTDLKRLLLRG